MDKNNPMTSILVTGGTGYIGSHTCIALLENGYDVTIVDNLSNSSAAVLDRIAAITGKKPDFHKVDLLNAKNLEAVFQTRTFDAVIHFAGFKAVSESVSMPLAYYHNNITGTLNLCRLMQTHNVFNMVFSSSATVYGETAASPVTEESPLSPANPYGRTKRMIEMILQDIAASNPAFKVSLLRYFNPVGAHESGLIGEDPRGIPNNLMPYISQVAVGRLPRLNVFGSDYPTPDGTGVRDYIHVMDLAEGHVNALEHLDKTTKATPYNLGTGKGYSVLELISAFENASGRSVPYTVTPRRPGDVAILYADPAKANTELAWRATRGIETICADAWRWQSQNPDGYADAMA